MKKHQLQFWKVLPAVGLGLALFTLPARAQAEAKSPASASEAAAETPATNSPPELAPESKSLASALAKLDYRRTPEALFRVMQAKSASGALSEAETFQVAVLLGGWPAVKATLQRLPKLDAELVYAKLLQSLAGSSTSATAFFQRGSAPPARGQTPNSGGSEEAAQIPRKSNEPKQGLLLTEDFYALVDAAPGNLKASSLPHFVTLVKNVIGEAGRKDFLARLETGLKGLGGATPGGHKLAAQVLAALGWLADAGPYLPLAREAWDQADTPTLLLTLDYFTQTGIRDRDERQLKRAAELCAFMMQASRFGANDRGLFRQATDQFVKLLPALGATEAEQLIRENFLTQPAILLELILALGESGQQAQKSADLNLRGQSLATQTALLKVLAGRRSELPVAANLLVMNWLGEAETTYRAGGLEAPEEDEVNNSFIVRQSIFGQRRRGNAAKVLETDVILAHAPPPALLARLSEALAQRVNFTLLKINLLDPKMPATLAALTDYLKAHPGQERRLCEDYLTAWVKQRSIPPEDPNIVRMRNLGYNISSSRQQSSGIPLTRLRQNQHIAEYQVLLAALRALAPEPINPNLVVQGFMAIHSGAEVYRLEDITAIFGPPEKMNPGELLELVTGMRAKLREQWQDPKVQQAASSNRTEEEAKDAVSGGYRTALALVKAGLNPQAGDWPQLIVRGQLFFDAAEYEFSRNIKLTDYVSLRDEAFTSYRRAAENYAVQVPELPQGQWTLEPYKMWFFVMLGASDLSQLTRGAARADPGLKQIGDAMRALPGAAAEGHLEKFGGMLASLLSQVPGHMRQRFLSAGLQVLGAEHPSAKPALESLRNYQELLDEVQLSAVVDGPTAVGHGQPFGLFLSLAHTRQLARESGGFAKYLQNAADRGGRSSMSMGAPAAAAEYRNNFTKNIHAALDETFEISSITFHGAEVRALDLPREGWQETPLAYVLLRAKEAAVDRVPSIQIDMDFSDTSGQVVLPVRSAVVPIDAQAAAVPARPCGDLDLTFTMDEREWSKGLVVVEITAHGHGVIAAPQTLFDYAQPGLTTEVLDNGLSITEFVSDGKTRQAHADRNWQFTYKRTKDLKGDVTLHFPKIKPGVAVAKVEYKHYRDADLVELDAQTAAAGVALPNGVSRSLRDGAVLLILSALALGGWLWRRARGGKTSAVVASLKVPETLTPFSTVAFLRRIQREAAGRLDEAARKSLQAEIEGIETAYFRRALPAEKSPDLAAVASKWLQLTTQS